MRMNFTEIAVDACQRDRRPAGLRAEHAEHRPGGRRRRVARVRVTAMVGPLPDVIAVSWSVTGTQPVRSPMETENPPQPTPPEPGEDLPPAPSAPDAPDESP